MPGARGVRSRMRAAITAQRQQQRLAAGNPNRVLRGHLRNNPAAILRRGPVERVSRMDLVQSMKKAQLIRMRSRSRSNVNKGQAVPQLRRSNSRSNLQAARSQSNLRRSNSRLNLNMGNNNQGGSQQQQQQPRRKINRDFQQRSRSRSRSRQQAAPSIASRLGVRPGNKQQNNNNQKTNIVRGRSQSRQRSNSISARLGTKPQVGNNKNSNGNNTKQKRLLNRVAQGRVSKNQRLGVQQAKKNITRIGGNQGKGKQIAR